MLATKAMPEMEAEESELLQRQSQAAAGTPLGAQYEKLGVNHLQTPRHLHSSQTIFG